MDKETRMMRIEGLEMPSREQIEAAQKLRAKPQFATEEEEKAAARIAYNEAGYWYNMLERYVYDTPALPKMNARLAELAKLAGIKWPQ